MPTATGFLTYDPAAFTVRRKAWWCILECGSGWFWWYKPQLLQELPGEWMWAVDRDRVFEGGTGSRVDKTPHLALVRPTLSPPAWGPHISIMRGEKPRRNLDVWQGKRKGPKFTRPGAPIEFTYDLHPHTNGHHWLLRVESETLGDLRDFYGLSRKPRVRFHLTFAIQTD